MNFKEQTLTSYYEFPNILLDGYKNVTKKVAMKDCWNLCETNSIIKCAAISYNIFDKTCYLYDSEFFEKENVRVDNEFTTLMRKSKLLLAII